MKIAAVLWDDPARELSPPGGEPGKVRRLPDQEGIVAGPVQKLRHDLLFGFDIARAVEDSPRGDFRFGFGMGQRNR